MVLLLRQLSGLQADYKGFNMNENYAYLTCKCGAKIQVLKTTTQTDEEGKETVTTYWDEEATAKAFKEHKC